MKVTSESPPSPDEDYLPRPRLVLRGKDSNTESGRSSGTVQGGDSLGSKRPSFASIPLCSDARQRIQAAGSMHIPYNEIRRIEKIGEGSYGTVYRGRYSHMEVAIKVAKRKWKDMSTEE